MRLHLLNHMVAKIFYLIRFQLSIATFHMLMGDTLFSFCSVSVPIPLCCHLLSLGPCGGLLARFCGVQSGCRGPVEVGGGWVDYGQHAHQAHIQPSSSRHVGLLYVTALHAAHSLPPSPLLPVAPRNPSFPQCLRLT